MDLLIQVFKFAVNLVFDEFAKALIDFILSIF